MVFFDHKLLAVHQKDALSSCIGYFILEDKVLDVVRAFDHQISFKTAIYGVFLNKNRTVVHDVNSISQGLIHFVHEYVGTASIFDPYPKTIVVIDLIVEDLWDIDRAINNDPAFVVLGNGVEFQGCFTNEAADWAYLNSPAHIANNPVFQDGRNTIFDFDAISFSILYLVVVDLTFVTCAYHDPCFCRFIDASILNKGFEGAIQYDSFITFMKSWILHW